MINNLGNTIIKGNDTMDEASQKLSQFIKILMTINKKAKIVPIEDYVVDIEATKNNNKEHNTLEITF